MDPIKTGEWIAARRKEKELTQKDLAARLGVTDKAVSRWETGKGYPDISLLPALAEELDCTVNELLSGKRLSPEEAPAAAEENIKALCRTAGQPLPNERRLFDDSRVEIHENQIVIRWGFGHAFSVGIFLIMVVIGGILASKLLHGAADWEWSFPDFVGVIFFGVWLLGIAVLLIALILKRTSTLTIDRDGVSLKRPIGTKALRWEQIRDYGVAYSHRDRALLYYELYFSDSVLPENERGVKKVQKATVRIDLAETLMDRYVCPIMDFCDLHTNVTPFLIHPYDRLRFQNTKFKTKLVPQLQPLREKPGRRLLALAFAILALGLGFPVLDRFLNPQMPSMVLRLIGAGIALLGGLTVLWANVRRLRRENSRVEEFDWTSFLEVLTVALLSVALGVFLLVLALH